MVVIRKQQRTAITIQRELKRIAWHHRGLLALGSTNKKDRKKLLEPRHAESNFPLDNNYDDDDDDDDDNYINDDTCDDTYVDDFDDPRRYTSLFDEFARTVCQTKIIPRKELFEAWAMALYVHHYFPPSKSDDHSNSNGKQRIYYGRVADLACGNSLLSWAILFLDRSRNRTAICVDKKVPKSCDIIERVMMEYHPSVVFEHIDTDPKQQQLKAATETQEKVQAQKRWYYVEGDINRNVIADSTTLIVGVHCCGTLSDSILNLAIDSNAPLALVPCCHTVRSLPVEQQKDEIINSILKHNTEENNRRKKDEKNNNDDDDEHILLPTNKTDYIDRYRIQKLIAAGYVVHEERIPAVITPKNRIIIATPSCSIVPITEDVLEDENKNYFRNENSNTKDNNASNSNDNDVDAGDDSSKEITTMHGNKQQRWKPTSKIFTIPLADTKSAKSIVASQLSGRLAARMRKRRPPMSLNISLFLPHPDALPPELLNELSEKVVTEHTTYAMKKSSDIDVTNNNLFIPLKIIIATHVEYATNGSFTDTETGFCSRPFRIKYQIVDPTGMHPQVTKDDAKKFHREVCRRIPIEFPGIQLRQGIR